MAISGITTKIISKLGDSAGSIAPVFAKDTGTSITNTLIYAKNGSKQDGKEKAIEEFGTEIIWLGGIPLLKKAFDLTAYKIAGIDPRFDVRKLNPKNVDNIGVMIEHARNNGLDGQLAMLEKINKNGGKLAKVLFASKFVMATAATLVALTALIKFKQKTTEKDMQAKIEKQIIKHREKLRDVLRAGADDDKKFAFYTRQPNVEPAEVMKQKKFSVEALSIADAELALDTSDHTFYVYANKQNGKINIMYRRTDGNVGIIEVTNSKVTN